MKAPTQRSSRARFERSYEAAPTADVEPMLHALEASPWPDASRERARLREFLDHDWDALMKRAEQSHSERHDVEDHDEP